MEIAIVGFPKSGKTTMFNALTKGTTAITAYSNSANVGVSKVPDERLDVLASIYNPQRVVPAEVSYIDVPPPPEGFGDTKGISGEYLNALQSSDALLIVARSFSNPSVPHINQTIEPYRDITDLLLEINFSDLGIIERRISKINQGYKGASNQERESLTKELNLMEELKALLEKGIALRDIDLSYDQNKLASGFSLLSIKPLLIVMNISESDIEQSLKLDDELESSFPGPRIRTAAICAQLEMELSQMSDSEESDFRRSLSMEYSSLARIIRLSYDVVDQISFFTVGDDEVRAWEIPRGTTAQSAARRIHSDLERGFIRAEVVPYSELINCGSYQEAKKLGLIRQEGKQYIVQDGEIVHVLFNV